MALAPRPLPVALAPISVVIPTHNRGALLEQTLEQCRRCAGGLELEFVVVDDGSTDDTARRLADLSKDVPELVWRSVESRGPGRARNVGATLASHDVVLFMGDDIQPVDDDFFRVHAELHAQHPEPDLAVLGKVVWPGRRGSGVSFVMAHVQGRGGEQFGYSDFLPYSFVDWRFFYTANISLRKSIVDDWMTDGFREDFTAAAHEDGEFAYRMFQRERGLRIFYTPASVGTHHHWFSVDDFMNRQLSAGMMARVFVDLHPGPEVRSMIGLGGVFNALHEARGPDPDTSVADYLSVIEGVKSWARLIESDLELGAQHWHDDLVRAVFKLCYQQGFVLDWAKPDANLGAAYRFVLNDFARAMTHSFHIELTGPLFAADALASGFTYSSPHAAVWPRSTRLWRWAASKPALRAVYDRLRRHL